MQLHEGQFISLTFQGSQNWVAANSKHMLVPQDFLVCQKRLQKALNSNQTCHKKQRISAKAGSKEELEFHAFLAFQMQLQRDPSTSLTCHRMLKV